MAEREDGKEGYLNQEMISVLTRVSPVADEYETVWAADPVALVQDRESSIAVCGRQSDCCRGMSDPRKSATDGPGKSAHQERPSQNRRPLLTRAKLTHGMASTFDETGSYPVESLFLSRQAI